MKAFARSIGQWETLLATVLSQNLLSLFGYCLHFVAKTKKKINGKMTINKNAIFMDQQKDEARSFFVFCCLSSVAW
jgi:hypothetical protein